MSQAEIPVCFWHGPEPDQPGDYKACGECLHVWRTEAAFARDVADLYAELRAHSDWPPNIPLPPLDRIYSCPLCAHDF